jgi:hypothetical protein
MVGTQALFLLGAAWIVIAMFSAARAGDKGMSWPGGFLLGLILGPLGLAIILLMPRRTA